MKVLTFQRQGSARYFLLANDCRCGRLEWVRRRHRHRQTTLLHLVSKSYQQLRANYGGSCGDGSSGVLIYDRGLLSRALSWENWSANSLRLWDVAPLDRESVINLEGLVPQFKHGWLGDG